MAYGGSATGSTKRRKTLSSLAAAPAPEEGGGLFGLGFGPDVNLGVGNLVGDIKGIVPGLIHLGVNAAQAPFSSGARTELGHAGKGMLSSLIGTGETALGAMLPYIGHKYVIPRISDLAEKVLGEGYRPEDLYTRMGKRGILSAAAEDVGNLALAGGTAEKLGSLGRVGKLGRAEAAANIAEEAGTPRAAAAAAKAANRAEGLSAPEAAVASRAKVLEALHKMSHPYEGVGRAVRPLTRAAAESVAAEVAPVAEEATAAVRAPEEAALAAKLGTEAPEVAGTPPRVGPAEQAAAAKYEAPISPRAAKIVEALPDFAKNALNRVEGRLQRRDVRQIIRERERFTEAARRSAIKSPGVQAMVDAARDHLVGQALADGTKITPELASGLVGDEIGARLSLVKDLENALPGVAPEVFERVRPTASDTPIRESHIPAALMSPELETVLGKATDLARQAASEKLDTLAGSRLGMKGLEGVVNPDPTWTKGEHRMFGDAASLLEQARGVRERAGTLKQTLESAPDKLIATADSILGSEGTPGEMTEAAADAQRIMAKAQSSVEQMFKEADRLEAKASARLIRLSVLRDNPSIARAPAEWKPLWGAIEGLTKEAEVNPALADLLGDMPKVFSDVMRFAAERGLDPTHIRSFTEGEVRRFAYEAVTLGKKGRELGMEVESGTRKARRMANARTRSIEAFVAAQADVANEANTNALVTFIEDRIAKPLEKGAEPPDGWVAWDPMRSFILTGEKAGASAATKMIPKQVRRLLQGYSKDYTHGIFRTLSRATSPWRALVLTWTPRWYVNNFFGNTVVATAEGVRMPDWLRAIRSYRKDFADIPEAVGHSIVANELGNPQIVPFAKGRAGFREAAATGKQSGEVLGRARAVYRLAAERMTRANSVVDDIARAAVYHFNMRTVGSAEHALMRSYEALVDYGNLSPLERDFVRAVVPFYSWQKGILRIVAKLPVDHPVGLAMTQELGRLNEDMAKEQGLPEYYSGLLRVPGMGSINTRPLNPFSDAGTLITPQGIAQAANPYVQVFLHAVGGPGDLYPKHARVDEFGRAVPHADTLGELTDIATGVPQARAMGSGQDFGSFLGGTRRYSDAQVQAIKDRAAKARETAAKVEAATAKREARGGGPAPKKSGKKKHP